MTSIRSISPPLPLSCEEEIEAGLTGCEKERPKSLAAPQIDSSLPPAQSREGVGLQPVRNEIGQRPRVWRQDRVYEYGRRSRKRNDDDLVFESEFESGNLYSATRIYRQYREGPEYSPRKSVDHEYDLQMHPDVKTSGNTQWFFFRVSGIRRNVHYRFNITNFLKADSLYLHGMQPVLYSTKASENDHIGWRRAGRVVSYSRNDPAVDRIQRADMRTAAGKAMAEDHVGDSGDDEDSADDDITAAATHTMSVDFEFEYEDDYVYLAYAVPYLYTDLQKFLEKLTSSPAQCRICSRRLLCKTLAGNRCDLVTITAPRPSARIVNDDDRLEHRRVIVLSARVHPGETNSSWMMHGILHFLTSEEPYAKLLRDHFIFKIVPMLNPDGVINGNYRCNLSGADLNRQWQSPSEYMHPTIASLKQVIAGYQLRGGDESQVALFCDLHGHSRAQGLFLYGIIADKMMRRQLSMDKYFEKHLGEDDVNLLVNSATLSDTSGLSASTSIHRVKRRSSSGISSDPRMFPVMLARRTAGIFAKKQTSFKMYRNKSSTARAVVSRELGVRRSYTLEASFCAGISGIHQYNQFTTADFVQMGRQFCLALVDLFDLDLDPRPKEWSLNDESRIRRKASAGPKHSKTKKRVKAANQNSHTSLPNTLTSTHFVPTGLYDVSCTQSLSTTRATLHSSGGIHDDLTRPTTAPQSDPDLSLAIKILKKATQRSTADAASLQRNEMMQYTLRRAFTELPLLSAAPPESALISSKTAAINAHSRSGDIRDLFAPPRPTRRKSISGGAGGLTSTRRKSASFGVKQQSRLALSSARKSTNKSIDPSHPPSTSHYERW